MIFHSLTYVAFLASVLAVYWLLERKLQNCFLIGASVVFYGAVHPWFLIPFAVTTMIDYTLALAIERRRERARWYVAASVFSNLGLLALFKYYNFGIANLSAALSLLHWQASLPLLRIVLPAGISFYTFQSIGYVVDVYRGHIAARRSLRDYALFVSFFPQLVAGPIQRAAQLLTQIERRRSLSPPEALQSLSLMLWGFFKKVVIADNLGLIANKVFALPDPSFPLLWAGVLAFCIQIYADFSGYTDIARGSAALFGFKLTLNFNHPYLAESPSDFWRRWHMSLSQWIRDYIYIPLGGSRAGRGRETINLVIVFLLIGLWHGASWNFVLWGFYNAVLTLIYRVAEKAPPSLPWPGLPGGRAARVLIMFAFTNVGWLIFREQNVAQLGRDLALSPFAAAVMDWRVAAYLTATVLLYALPLAAQTVWDLRGRRLLESLPFSPRASAAAWCAATVSASLSLAGILLLRSDSPTDFIYFQF